MRIYLAGPINGCTDEEATAWRADVKRTSHHTVIDPMVRDYRGKEEYNVTRIVQDDKTDIKGCGAILANLWKLSPGTIMELLYAWENGVYVVTVSDSHSPWIRYHSNFLTADLHRGIAHLNNLDKDWAWKRD